jgi:hypothetical protein
MRGIPNSSATLREDSAVLLHTTTISTPGISRNPGMCFARVFEPAPTIPMRIFFSFAYEATISVLPFNILPESKKCFQLSPLAV